MQNLDRRERQGKRAARVREGAGDAVRAKTDLRMRGRQIVERKWGSKSGDAEDQEARRFILCID